MRGRKSQKTLQAEKEASDGLESSSGQVFGSMAAAASALKVSKDILRRLHREGAPGFRGSRVYAAELLPYLRALQVKVQQSGQPVSKDALECRKLLAQAERLELRLAIERREHVKVQLLSDHLRRFGAEVKQVLRQKESEFPALADRLPADQIKPLFITHITDDLLQKFAAHFDSWTI